MNDNIDEMPCETFLEIQQKLCIRISVKKFVKV